jgi:hypothetical protein
VYNLKIKNWAWWHTPGATLEAEMGAYLSPRVKGHIGQHSRIPFKGKGKKEGRKEKDQT